MAGPAASGKLSPHPSQPTDIRMNRRSIAPAAVALALAALTGSATAAAADDSELVRCAQIRDDAERLECFDRAARRKTGELETGGDTAPAAAPAAAPAPPTEAPPPRTTAPAAEDFGAEQTRRAPDKSGPNSIRTTIEGYFEGFTGGTEIRLANGQLWIQTDAARLPVKMRDPEVVIEKGFFGGYRLSVEGLNRSIRVRRVE